MRKATMLILLTTVIILLAACQQEPSALYTPQPSATQTELPPVPTITETILPSQTAEFTPAIAVQSPEAAERTEARLVEEFADDDTCFETFARPEASGTILDGSYILEVKAGNVIAQANCETLVIGDLQMRATVQVLEQPEGSAFYYGLVFHVEGQEYYAFVLGSEGGYCLYYADAGAFVPLTGSTDFASPCWARIPQGVLHAEGNILDVVMVNDRIDFMVNGDLMGVVRDGKLKQGWIGFIVASGQTGGIRVSFDDLWVADP